MEFSYQAAEESAPTEIWNMKPKTGFAKDERRADGVPMKDRLTRSVYSKAPVKDPKLNFHVPRPKNIANEYRTDLLTPKLNQNFIFNV